MTLSEEGRKRLSLSKLGNHNVLGRKHTEEEKRKAVETRMKNGSYKFSEQQKRNMSLASKGRIATLEARKNMSLCKIGNKANLGKKFSEEWKRHIKEAKIKSGYCMSDETKKKMSLTKKGKFPWNKGLKNVYSEKTLNIMRNASKGNKNMLGKHHTEETKNKISVKGFGRPNFKLRGHKHTEETKRKLSELRRGNKSFLWNGGISYAPYTREWTNTLKRAIRQRDNYTCQLCFKEGLHVHHIDYEKKNCNPENLITLCHRCHSKTICNRIFWTNFFQNKLYKLEIGGNQ